MPKQLVTVMGLIVSLGVIALGVFLVALPVYFQAVGVDAETATVADTNAIYQAQVDNLREQEADIEQINADVASLRAEIPSTGQLDDVFEVVARAAEASGVAITAVTAGDKVEYATRTSAEAEPGTTPAPQPTPQPTDAATDAPTDGAATSNVAGRQQVDFVISATAPDMAQATAFLDALRAGPRLLSTDTATTNQTGEGTVDIQLSALTYVDAEG
jgi:hypothetical protein